ncbi:sporulation protein [Domibacillus sp. DTU_2020_1001157_1_SI_ALB_TIR_016]|uniref:sporulation protein n=1 Tax=Domibacillus sp. DTU_2020_1001157_1_SI_ALB_TIR_016 TaxID=3077789 RepID=UPI0028E7D91E|nr:sporulation protein [Domibacillus sp. DTU_2020_1001157_1_SI_ALB_TIR_016]WNS80034.1 sporulation protein [Domibacillus sp. DTU_2020_1001157_1_SI_ALB_TIR_016]
MKKTACIILVLLLAGCGPEHDGTAMLEKADPDAVQLDGHDDQLAAEIKKEADSFDEIYDTAVVKGTKQLLVAYKVRHLERFRMKQIEKNLAERMKKTAEKEKVEIVVSSDYKIFLEAVRLKEDMEAGHFTEEEADKRLAEIIKLKKEMA